MELLDAMKARRSIRKFEVKPVPDEYITQLIEAERLAPSGSNLQPTRFVVVKSKDAREKLNVTTPLPFVAEAPVVIACCVDSESFDGLQNRYVELKEAGAFVDTPLDNPENSTTRRQMDRATREAYMRLNAAIAIEWFTFVFDVVI